MSWEIRKRNEGVAPAVQAIAWKAQYRLNGRYKKLVGRGKNKQQTMTALARELAGFVWSIARQPQLLADTERPMTKREKRAIEGGAGATRGSVI